MKNLKNKILLLFFISSLGRTPFSRLFTGATFFYYYVANIFDVPVVSCALRLVINGKQCDVFVRRISDFWVIKDVLVDREYEVSLKEPKVIIDLGANIGIASLFFATKYPNAVVYAVEPNPDIFKDLIANTSGFKNIKVYNVAISGKNGELDLYSGRSGAGSSIIRRSDSKKHYIVPAITLDGFFMENHIDEVDLLKFDIEGAETAIFRGFAKFEVVRFYVGEIHYDLNDLTSVEIRKNAPGYMMEERNVGKDRSIIRLSL